MLKVAVRQWRADGMVRKRAFVGQDTQQALPALQLIKMASRDPGANGLRRHKAPRDKASRPRKFRREDVNIAVLDKAAAILAAQGTGWPRRRLLEASA